MDIEYYATMPPPTSALPKNWLDWVGEAVKEYGKDVVSKGRGPGSLEPEETAGLDYRVVDGDAIKERMPWLWEWYTSDGLASFIGHLLSDTVRASEHVASAININYLRGVGGRYELHVDAQPYSVVLMGTQCDEATGGRLVLGARGDMVQRVNTRPGLLVAFNGADVPHAVEPLTGRGPLTRISLPMAFVPDGAAPRPKALDGFLYGGIDNG